MPNPLPEILQYFLSDCLQGNNHYTTKKLFGGYGIYFCGKIFATYSFESIYLKVGEQNKQDFLDAGAKQFTYTKQGKDAHISYYILPEELLEDREELQVWIDKALDY